MLEVLEERKIGKITWIFGQSGAGKTSLALSICNRSPEDAYCDAVWLDGDLLRLLWKDMKMPVDLSTEGREDQNIRTAHLAKYISERGINVVISVICPYRALRKKIKQIIPDCKFIYIEGGEDGEDKPFEHPVLY